jgi:hypothetical protein
MYVDNPPSIRKDFSRAIKGIAVDVCGLSLRGLDASNPLLIYHDTENRNVFGIFLCEIWKRC